MEQHPQQSDSLINRSGGTKDTSTPQAAGLSGNSSGESGLSVEEASSIFMRHIDFVRTIAEKNAPSKSLIDDVVHDTLVYFLKNKSVWQYDEKKILGLLKSITLHIAHRHWREHIKHMPSSLRTIAEHLRQEGLRRSGSDESDRSSRRHILKACLQKLSPENRELVEVLYFSELGYQEASRLTGRSRQAIYTQMSRIRALLHQCVRKVMEMEVRDV